MSGCEPEATIEKIQKFTFLERKERDRLFWKNLGSISPVGGNRTQFLHGSACSNGRNGSGMCSPSRIYSKEVPARHFGECGVSCQNSSKATNPKFACILKCKMPKRSSFGVAPRCSQLQSTIQCMNQCG